METTERICAVLLGGAYGDALGSRFEGLPGSEIPRSPSARFEASAAICTDDTQLTLATCQAILKCQGRVDPAAVADEFLAWFRQGKLRGVGASTAKALRDLDAGGHWALVGRKGEFAAGNGAAMRIASLAFVLNSENVDDRRIIRDVCRITHHSEEAYAGALAVVIAVRRAMDGGSGQPLLAEVAGGLPDSVTRDRLLELAAAPSPRLKEVADRFGTSGYVADTVPLALAAATQVGDATFDSLIDELIQCGGDTDTVGSLFGQIAGAMLGPGALPPAATQLPLAEEIIEIATQFGRFMS